MVTVFSKNACVQCKQTKMFLEARGIPFIEKNIEENDEYHAEAKLYGFKAAPVVVPDESLGLNAWAGFRPDELRKLIK